MGAMILVCLKIDDCFWKSHIFLYDELKEDYCEVSLAAITRPPKKKYSKYMLLNLGYIHETRYKSKLDVELRIDKLINGGPLNRRSSISECFIHTF